MDLFFKRNRIWGVLFLLLFTPLVANDSKAYISFADSAWEVQYWNDGKDYSPIVVNEVPVTGYGTYTVGLDFSKTVPGFAVGMAFMDVEISNGEANFPNSFMTINSMKINGETVSLGKTYTTSDDDVVTRTNLYNEWVAEVEEGRTKDGDITDLTPTPVDKSLYKEIESIEVTFTLGEGIPFGDSGVVEAKPLPAEGTTAYIAMADNSWTYQHWFDGKDYSPIVANNATVTGYGEYTVSLDFSGVEGGVCPDIVFMDVEVDNGELYFPYNIMEIKSVSINGEKVTLTGNPYTTTDNKEDTRVNLFNSWVGEVTEGRTEGLALTDVTAVPVDGTKYTNIKTVEVTFELKEGEPVIEEEEEYVFPESYNAFMMFSDVSGAWEKYAPGTSGDTAVIGDGIYTVYLTAAEVGATGPATEGQVFLVDIENLGEAMVNLGTLKEADNESLTITDAKVKVKVFIDGKEVISRNKNILIGDIEGNGRFRIELFNKWGTGTQDSPVVTPDQLTPESEIKVMFSLEGTGLNTGAVTDLDSVVVENNNESSAPVALIIIICAVVLAAVVIILIRKKRK